MTRSGSARDPGPGDPGPRDPGRAPRLFVFGLGFSALALAECLAAKGWRIAGTCRSADKRQALEARGFEVHPFDREHPLADVRSILAGTTHLLASVPPDGQGPSGDPVLDVHGADILALGRRLAWVGYLSTTGVYGDRSGGWVDETSALKPSGERGQRRVAAERGWLRLWQDHEIPVHLFRLAGIYGPGRNALDAVRSGTAKRVIKPGQVFSRIHVADIATVLEASIARPHPGAAYNLCDDDPAPPAEVTEYACRLLGVEPPPAVPFDEAGLSPMARSFYDDNKRVRNDRIKRELGVVLAYPNYREGLKALLEA
jgi:nucleoside-diphosphate-sugar epimerase